MTAPSRRLYAALAITAGLTAGLTAITAPAHGVPPERTVLEPNVQVNVVSDLCAFPVTVTSTFPHTRKVDFYDSEGALTRTTYHILEQDAFTNPETGTTLQGLPYRFTSVLSFDDDGGITSAYASGHHVRVPLPDGSTFLAAGRVDFFQQGGDFVSVPDSGTSKNADAFCAALAG